MGSYDSNACWGTPPQMMNKHIAWDICLMGRTRYLGGTTQYLEKQYAMHRFFSRIKFTVKSLI